MFVNNFGKCDRFPKFFHQLIHKKILYVYTTDFHLTCNTLWMSKIQKMLQILTAPQQTVDKFLRTLWTLDLTFNSSWTNCPETADTEWLPNVLKYGMSDDVSNQQLNIVQLNVVALRWFFTAIIFAPSSSFLGYVHRMLYIYFK